MSRRNLGPVWCRMIRLGNADFETVLNVVRTVTAAATTTNYLDS
jgi:hypothetical protein